MSLPTDVSGRDVILVGAETPVPTDLGRLNYLARVSTRLGRGWSANGDFLALAIPRPVGLNPPRTIAAVAERIAARRLAS